MNAKEANKLSQIERDLIKKFRTAEKEEIKRRNVKQEEIKKRNMEDGDDDDRPLIQHFKPISVAEAQQLSNLQEQLHDEFVFKHKREIEDEEQLEKQYKPITRAIKAIEKPSETTQDLVPVRFATSTPRRAIRFEDEESDEEEDTQIVDESSSLEEGHSKINQSMKSLIESNTINLGGIATLYLPLANDKRFGIYFDEKTSKAKIGSEPITFSGNDIILVNSGDRYVGTPGLWQLLTKNDYIDGKFYKENDWEKYKEILIKTNSLYQNNDPKQGKPKSSRGDKWKKMVSQIWDEIKNKKGSGLAKYNENPIEYKYVNSFKDLFDRLQYLQAQELAGNNNFHNEKLSVVRFVNDYLEDLMSSPKFYKYMLRIITCLPETLIEGSGIFNDLLNNLPFEAHWPGYQALGPGTHLKEREARGETGINPLDEAAFEHDRWYRDHRKTEDRWVADKILQKKAWERVKSDDADIIGEKLPALVTTGAMWLKRKLGLGLNSSSFEYPD